MYESVSPKLMMRASVQKMARTCDDDVVVVRTIPASARGSTVDAQPYHQASDSTEVDQRSNVTAADNCIDGAFKNDSVGDGDSSSFRDGVASYQHPHDQRVKLLQLYFPQGIVDVYCPLSSRGDTHGKPVSHDALFEALRKVPHLVVDESPFERYLMQLCGSSTSTDPSVLRDAAVKIANYWKARKELFEERWLLPMIMTSLWGDEKTTVRAVGALSEEDMAIYNTGYCALLPNTIDPLKKRSVCAFDRSHLPPKYLQPAYEKHRMRHIFYSIQLMSLNPVTQVHGIVTLGIPLAPIPPSEYQFVGGLTLIRDAFPVADYECHGLPLPSKINSLSSAFQLASLLFGLVVNFVDIHKREMFGTYKMHVGTTDDSVLCKLIQDSFFNRADIPEWMGGTGGWNMEHFHKWQRKQYRIERKKHFSEEEEERRRRINTKARTRRDEESGKIKNLQYQTHELQLANQVLEVENGRLQSLLQYASSEVEIIEGCNKGREKLDDLDIDLVFSDDEENITTRKEESLDDEFDIDLVFSDEEDDETGMLS